MMLFSSINPKPTRNNLYHGTINSFYAMVPDVFCFSNAISVLKDAEKVNILLLICFV